MAKEEKKVNNFWNLVCDQGFPYTILARRGWSPQLQPPNPRTMTYTPGIMGSKSSRRLPVLACSSPVILAETRSDMNADEVDIQENKVWKQMYLGEIYITHDLIAQLFRQLLKVYTYTCSSCIE